MGIFDWFRKKRKKDIDKEKEVLERTGKLQTEIKKQVEPKKRGKKRRKKKRE